MSRPVKVTDDQILSVIRELKLGSAVITGMLLRRELQKRFQARCGTQRIYRFLNSGPESKPDLHIPDDLIEQLTRERDAAIARAELAEFREREHQDRWAKEIDRLRQALKPRGKI